MKRKSAILVAAFLFLLGVTGISLPPGIQITMVRLRPSHLAMTQ